MGRINLAIIVFLCSNILVGQEKEPLGDGNQSVFFQGEPEFLSLNIDHILVRFENERDIAIRTGFMINFSLWMGVPIEINYVIPVGPMYNHVEVGALAAFTWDSKKNPYEFYFGPRLGFRRQKNDFGLFYRFGIAYSFNRYTSISAKENSFKLKPSISMGYSF